ncbi:hypothetical protein RRG08_027588 [Elysia crispata]|uniref:Uncharacterized protein n=1 Tax=Elysia crispata TaxID=231223 RepID=A0AAE1DY62_9GAST|nr:hypothetical protein RRG08_027588 [Elysia crispata]
MAYWPSPAHCRLVCLHCWSHPDDRFAPLPVTSLPVLVSFPESRRTCQSAVSHHAPADYMSIRPPECLSCMSASFFHTLKSRPIALLCTPLPVVSQPVMVSVNLLVPPTLQCRNNGNS